MTFSISHHPKIRDVGGSLGYDGQAATLTVDPVTSNNGEHSAVVEEMLWTARKEKYSLFPNGELSQNA